MSAARFALPRIGIPALAVVVVVLLTIAAAVYRVSTAPDRRRIRLDDAKQSCIKAGGEWVRLGNDDHCRRN